MQQPADFSGIFQLNMICNDQFGFRQGKMPLPAINLGIGIDPRDPGRKAPGRKIRN